MNLNYINKTLAMKYLDNDLQLFKAILQSFKQHYKNIDFLKLDDKEFFKQVHHLKALSKNIGAIQLFDIAYDIHITKSRATQEKLQNILKAVLKEASLVTFAKILSTENKKKQTFIKSKKQILSLLLEAAKKNRPKKVENAIMQLQSLENLDKQDLKLISKLNEELNQYNFKEIVNILS